MQLPEDVWRGQPGQWFFLCTKDQGQWREYPFQRGDWEGVRNFIDEAKGVDVYWCVHGFNSRRRRKENSLGGHWLYADLDEVDPKKIEIKPTIAIESSPGRYVGLWKVDEFDESVNRRLTYAVGADKSGWDLTQVLRVPGTRNWKYPKGPRVNMMWANGVNYKAARLDRKLPELEESTGDEETTATKIWDEWEEKMPPWVRREMMVKEVPAGKRSEMLWKLAHTFLERGMSKREALVLLKSSAWNKFRGRRNEDDQLEREIDKASRRKFRRGDKEGDFGLVVARLEDKEPIDWLWFPYLARGEITILEGDPDTFKSMITEAITVALCNGTRLKSLRPSFGKRPQAHKVVLFDCENSRTKVIIPRLESMGMKNWENCLIKEESFSLVDKQQEVYAVLEEVHPSLIVFDTLNSYFGSADPNKGTEVAQTFQLFADLARKFNCSVLVIRHLTKGGRDKAIYRGQGSVSFSGKARVVLTAASHPTEEEMKVIAAVKNNLPSQVPKNKQTIEFEIKPTPTLKNCDDFKFEWGEFIDFAADDLHTDEYKPRSHRRDEIKKWLGDSLADGPKEWRELERMMKAHNKDWTERTMRRAAKDLGIIMSWKGRTMTWSLRNRPDVPRAD